MGLVVAALIPVLTSVGIGAATAGVVANIAVIAVGLGLSLLVSTIFKPSQPKPSDGNTVIRQAALPRFRSYGRVKVAGLLVFANTKAGVLDRVFAIGSGEIDAVEEHWIDDQLVTVDGGGGVGGKYAGKCVLQYRLGTDAPAPYSSLIAAWPDLWTADHLGKGIPSAHMQQFQVKAEQMGDLWPNLANTQYRQVQRGAKVRALFGGFTEPAWNDNAALVIMDYLTHPDGLGLDDSWIVNAFESWAAAQLACDEFVPLVAGGEERRYRIWNTYRFDERPADVLARFMQACDATIFPTPGQGLSIKVGKWEAPTVTLDDDAIVAFSEVGRGRDVLTTANTVRAQFMSPLHDYQETDAQVWVDSADVAARGEFATDLEFFCAPSHAQCRRLMKIAAHRANPDWVGTFVCNLRAATVIGERFINVECDELGISGTFEVLSTRWITEGGTIVKGIEVQIASLTAAAYDWSAVEEEGEAPAVPDVIVSENELPMPTGFGVGISGDNAVLAWDAPPEDFIAVDAQYKRTADGDWLAIPVADGATSVMVGPLVDGEEYEFQIRHRSTPTDRVTDWTASLTLIFDASHPEDWGHITDTVVTYEDWGHITETTGTTEDYGHIV